MDHISISGVIMNQTNIRTNIIFHLQTRLPAEGGKWEKGERSPKGEKKKVINKKIT
jgi:hypothetical protein